MDSLISHQVAIDAILGEPPEPHYPSWYADIIKALPSAQLERKKGKWIDCNWSVRCSECDYSMPWAVRNYCPNCGARMVKGGEEDE